MTTAFNLSKSERELVVKALSFKLAAVVRSIRGEQNSSIREIRQGEANEIELLSLKFR